MKENLKLSEKKSRKALENLMVHTDAYESRRLQHAENYTEEPEYANQDSIDVLTEVIDDYFKLKVKLAQYDNLRKHFDNLTADILGENYFNMGMDVYECDRLCCRDIIRAYHNRFRISIPAVSRKSNTDELLLSMIKELQAVKIELSELKNAMEENEND